MVMMEEVITSRRNRSGMAAHLETGIRPAENGASHAGAWGKRGAREARVGGGDGEIRERERGIHGREGEGGREGGRERREGEHVR